MPSRLIAQWCVHERTCCVRVLKVHLACGSRNMQQWNVSNQTPLDGLLIVNKSHAAVTTSNWSIIWYQVYNDGECRQSSIIVVLHQYLQMISIVSPPCGVIQTMQYSLSHPWTQQWKSIVFHKITMDGCCCVNPAVFLKMNLINSSHYTGARLACFLPACVKPFCAQKKKGLLLCRVCFQRPEKLGQFEYKFFDEPVCSRKVTCLNSHICLGSCGQGKWTTNILRRGRKEDKSRRGR